MMYYFDGIMVVEGKGDVCYLSSFIDSEYVVLNGYDIPENVVEYLTHIKNRKILLCTDPDEAGETIRKNAKTKGIKAEDIVFDINKCNKKGKHGVAECEKEEILNKLSQYLTSKKKCNSVITQSDFSKVGLIKSKKLQDLVKKTFYLGDCNTKTLLKRINYNGITLKEIQTLNGNK